LILLSPPLDFIARMACFVPSTLIEAYSQNPSPFIESRLGDQLYEGHTGVVDKNVDALVSDQDHLPHRHPRAVAGDIQSHRLHFAIRAIP
jgi:hypothetical protein